MSEPSELPIAGWSVRRDGKLLTDSHDCMILVEKHKAQEVADHLDGVIVPLKADEAFSAMSEVSGLAYDAKAYSALSFYLMAYAEVGPEDTRHLASEALKKFSEPKGDEVAILGGKPKTPQTAPETLWGGWTGRGRFK